MDIEKDYWLYIEPHVYCVIKDRQALLYNTLTGATIETAVPEIITLLQALHEKENLGAICVQGKQLAQNPTHDFVVEFCGKNMGNIVDIAQLPEKPVQLMPVLNLQHDVDKLQKRDERSLGENLLYYLHTLNIYLYSGCQRSCPFCEDCFRQSLCCKKTFHGVQPDMMDIPTLQNLLSQIRYGNVGKINLLGGNLPDYPCYSELPSILADFQERVHIWNHYANFTDSQTVLPGFMYDIPVTFPVEDEAWQNCRTLLEDVRACYHFFITDATTYEKSVTLIKQYGIDKYKICPVYTGHNLNFFEEYIYTDRDDIFKSKIPFRRIFAHQKMNTHFFGTLTVLPTGDVYANVNCPSTGNIKTGRLLDIIHTEMLDNTAWRIIRDTNPCSKCLYQYLCPSPSNYEIAIGQPNLCHVKK